MHTSTLKVRRYSAQKVAPHNSELDPTDVVPFGLRGLTDHAVGLVVVIGLLLLGLLGLAEARWFLAGTVLLGGLWGFFLWLRHRQRLSERLFRYFTLPARALIRSCPSQGP